MPAIAPVDRPFLEEPVEGAGVPVPEEPGAVLVVEEVDDVGELVAVFVTVWVVGPLGVTVRVDVVVIVVWASRTRVFVWKTVTRTMEEVGTVVVVLTKEVTSLVRVMLVVITVEEETADSGSWVARSARFWIGADLGAVAGVQGKEKRL
jgi:hypothetical protein